MRMRGFTLIEILVVIVILAVVAATITLAIGSSSGDRQLEREAERARALFAYACEHAELTGREIGINLSADGYRFSHYDHEVWIPARDGELRPRKWPSQLTATLTRDGHVADDEKTPPDAPQLICFSSGELTAFELELTMPEVDRRYRIDGHPDGDVELATVVPHAR